MNPFIFQRTQKRAFTAEQLRAAHECLVNLGYRRSFPEFYAFLADYCEPFAEDAGLTEKAAAPYISNCLLELMEALGQTNLRSKMFALCSKEKRNQTELKIPVVSVSRPAAAEIALSVLPQLESVLPAIQEKILGFASPVVPGIRAAPRPGTGQITRILSGTKTLPSGSREPAKVSLLLEVEETLYEVPLYRNTQGAASVRTNSIPAHGSIRIESGGLLSMRQYEDVFYSIRNGLAEQSAAVCKL